MRDCSISAIATLICTPVFKRGLVSEEISESHCSMEILVTRAGRDPRMYLRRALSGWARRTS